MRGDLTEVQQRFYEKKLELARKAHAAERVKITQPSGTSLNELFRLGREIERYERKLGLR